MATRATTAQKGSAKKHGGSEQGPAGDQTTKRWWERLLIYPTLAVALVSAGPQWIDQLRAMTQNIQGSPKEADQQNRLWRKNLACSAAPFAWFNSLGNIKVDTTTCDSGDVLVRAMTPGNGTYFKWVALDDVVKSAGEDGGLIGPAHAATLPPRVSPVAKNLSLGTFKLAQMQANIICQRFIDQRRILRRIATPQGCFDEIIDTFNGQVVSRNPAPCIPQC